MSDNSPLFVSSIELLAHSIDLYTKGNEKKYKFIILHLANAIELILKDCLIDHGKSIYKNNSSLTIGIWDSFSDLKKKNVDISERPIIELLIDDRNTIQHRFGFPNSDAVYYYLEQVLKFFKRFLYDEYKVDLVEILKLYVTNEELSIVGLFEKEEDELTSLDKLFKLSPEAAVLQAYNIFENKIIKYIKPQRRRAIVWQQPEFVQLMGELTIEKYLSSKYVDEFQLLRNMRNRAAHTAHFQNDNSLPDWANAFRIAKEIIVGINKAEKDNWFEKWEENIKEQNNILKENIDQKAKDSADVKIDENNKIEKP